MTGGGHAARDATGRPSIVDPYIPERGNDGYDVLAYDLDLDYRVGPNLLDGRARITVRATEMLRRIAFDLVGLRVTAAHVDGRRARWRQANQKVRVEPVGAIPAGSEVEVELRYRGNPNLTGSTWGPVGWEELEDGVVVAAQPSGACTWFPCNDLAAQKAPYTVRFTTATAYPAVVNGLLRSSTRKGSTTTRVFEQNEPTSPYLMTVNVGPYREIETATEPVATQAVVTADDLGDYRRAFARQAEMMALFEDRFGPYPFEAGYTVVVCPEDLEIPLEAMGQSIFGRNHLDGRSERLIAHELAHQWFGNSLTAAQWRDVWLHEGFACYAEWLWSEEAGDRSADELAAHHHERLARQHQDVVLADPGPDEMFEDWVYKRGALTLHAVRAELGDAVFFDLLRRWVHTYRFGVVTTEQFESLAAEVAGRSLDEFFDPWLRSTELPACPVIARG